MPADTAIGFILQNQKGYVAPPDTPADELPLLNDVFNIATRLLQLEDALTYESAINGLLLAVSSILQDIAGKLVNVNV